MGDGKAKTGSLLHCKVSQIQTPTMERRSRRSGSTIPDYMLASKGGQRKSKTQQEFLKEAERGQKRSRNERTPDTVVPQETVCTEDKQEKKLHYSSKESVRSKFLPSKMTMLESLYAAIQSVIALKQMRNDKTTFQAMKKPLEVSVGKNITIKHVLQIHAVFPEGITIHCDQTNGSALSDLIIQLPDLFRQEHYPNHRIAISKWRELFRDKLLAYVDLHHQKFCEARGLSSCNYQDQWHAQFNPESIPDVNPSEIGTAKRSESNQKVHTTQSFQNNYSEAEGKEIARGAKVLEEKTGGALSHKSISQAVANECFHEKHFSQRAKDLRRQRRCLEHLPYTLESVHSIFSMSARSAKPLQSLVDLIHSRCNRYLQGKEEILQSLHFLALHAPEYCSINASKAGSSAAAAALGLQQPKSKLFKISRTADMARIIQKIQDVSTTSVKTN